MPFDGPGSAGNLALQKLDAVVALLATEGQWCRRRLRTPDGRHCLKGALRAVEAELLLEPIVLDAIRHVTGRWFWRIESFNDCQTTSHALLLRVLSQARQRVIDGHFGPEGTRPHGAAWFGSTTHWITQRVRPT
jgi:hypothetical protein